jgi:hypothetical protein
MQVTHGKGGPKYSGYPIIKHEDWLKTAESIWGRKVGDWKFQCPACGNVASVQEHVRVAVEKHKDLAYARGAALERAPSSCIGRFDGHMHVDMGTGQPCNYTNGGLICFAKALVEQDNKQTPVFLFYDPHPVEHQEVIGGVE